MKQKWAKIILLLIIVLMPISSFAKDPIIYEAELNYPPYKFSSDGFLTGFDIELSNMVFNNEDYTLKFSEDTWENVYQRLKEGKIDTCGMLVINDERKKDILFSKPIFKTYTAVYTNRGFKRINLEDIKNYRIGVGKNQYSENLLKNKLMIKEYSTFTTIEEALEALANDRIDILFENQEVVNYLIVEKGLKGEIIHQLINLYPQEVGYGFSKTRPDLVNYVNKKINEITKSGAFEEIYERYFFRKSEFYKEQMRRKRIEIALGGVALLIICFGLIRLYIKKLHKELNNEKELLDDILDNTDNFIIAVDSDKVIVKCNKNVEKFNLEISRIINKKYNKINKIKNDFTFIIEMFDRTLNMDFVKNEEISLINKSGKEIYFSFSSSVIFDSSGNPDVFILSGIDITEIKDYDDKLHLSYKELEATYEELAATEEELKEQYDELVIGQEKLRFSEERFRLATEAANDIIWEEDPETGTSYYSDRWFEILGYPKLDKDEQNELWTMLVHPEDEDKVNKAVEDHLSGKTPIYKCEYRLRTKDGEYKWILSKGKALRDSKGKVIRFIGSSTDITESKNYQFNLQKLAYYDSLTNLPNKTSFKEMFYKTTNSNEKAALLYIDIDNFKYINDTMGHSYGDKVLMKTGEGLSRIIGDAGEVYRLGGDEFSIILFNVEGKNKVEEVANSILKGFSDPIDARGGDLYISLSIGISMYPEDSKLMDELIVNSDIAMYKSKEVGKGTYTFFNESMRKDIEHRLTVEKQLSGALENNEMYLLYQPQFNVKTGKIDCFEALIRWENPVLGFVSPLSFISIAEESRLIIPIGEWVLKTACNFIKRLQSEGFYNYRVAVNISIVQLRQENFVEDVIRILEEADLSPEFLELEITESILMESFDYQNKKLEILKSKGIRIALDDFGTGYSSLSYLRKLKVNILKIDKAFINDIFANDESKSLTMGIIDIGHKVGLEVIAEGVEDAKQLKFLEENDCDKIQGYLFSKPVSVEEVLDMLKRIKDK